MNVRITGVVVGAVVAMSLMTNAVIARQAATGKPCQKFRGPLKAFIPAGQSNMQGHARFSTFEHIGMDPAVKRMLAEMPDEDGKPKVCVRVWISSFGCAEAEQTGKLPAGFGATTEKIGPEFTFGLYLRKFTDARPFWRDAPASPGNFGHHWNHNGGTHLLVGKGMGHGRIRMLPPPWLGTAKEMLSSQ